MSPEQQRINRAWPAVPPPPPTEREQLAATLLRVGMTTKSWALVHRAYALLGGNAPGGPISGGSGQVEEVGA